MLANDNTGTWYIWSKLSFLRHLKGHQNVIKVKVKNEWVCFVYIPCINHLESVSSINRIYEQHFTVNVKSLMKCLCGSLCGVLASNKEEYQGLIPDRDSHTLLNQVVTAPPSNAPLQVWASRVLAWQYLRTSRLAVFVKRSKTVNAHGPWVPSTDLNFQPFIVNGVISTFLKHSWVGWKTTHKHNHWYLP